MPILFIGLLTGCSNPHSVFGIDEEIESEVTDDQLMVKNNLVKPIHYFAVESELAARINWAAVSTEENRIFPFQRVNISLADIGVTEKGQNVAFFYWKVEEPETEDIECISIDTN